MALRKTASPAVKLDSLSDVNDLGKPWRFTDEDTGLTVTRSCVWSPPGCHPVGCGLKLYTDESGRLVKVEGDENHPVTQGRLCVRCIALKDYEYNNSRILHPMKRDRSQRGNADAWEEITWDEALDLIEERYTEITGKYGKESFVNFGGTGREGGVSCMTYTAMVWQTPNACYTQSGYACYFPRLAAGTMSAGLVYPEMDYAGCLPGRYDDPEYHVPEAVVLWGKVPTVSNPDGAFGHAVIDLMKRGSRLIMVDSRVNWLTTRAAYHLQLRPGTDTAIAMAMLDVIIREGLYDKEFVDKWCYGFEQLAERVATMPPERAAEICGVKAEDIIGAARLYANAEAATIQWGLATDQKTNGMQQAQCIIALMAITGNIDRPGGQITTGGAVALDADTEEDDEYMPYMALDDDELRGKMIGLKEYPAYCGMSQNSHADLTLRCMETDDPYPLRIGAFAGNNLLACTSAEPRRWEAAINRSLEAARALQPDVILAMLHWGSEATLEPTKTQESIAKQLFERGADAIIGSHSHLVGRMETMDITTDDGKEKTCFVAYSLGNFFSSQNSSYASGCEESVILNLQFTKNGETGETTLTNASYTPLYLLDSGKDADGSRYEILPIRTAIASGLFPKETDRLTNAISRLRTRTESDFDSGK